MFKWVPLILIASLCHAEPEFYPRQEPQISMQNKILVKVNGNVISVLDVMKKMDLLLHQYYSQYADATPARFQFYNSTWRSVFREMVDAELILADAKDKEIKLTDGEVREEMERRFGPNILQTLERIRLTYDDAWKMVKNELITQRMLWFFVQSKAIKKVSPELIRQAYRSYLAEHPSYQEWVYRVISIRKADPNEIVRLCQEHPNPEQFAQALQEWRIAHPEADVSISNEYVAKDEDLSESHRSALSTLTPNSYSQPIAAISRVDQSAVSRIFYLSEKRDHSSPTFETLAPNLKNELLQKEVALESEHYLNKLRTYYGFDLERLKETAPDDFKPFSLQ